MTSRGRPEFQLHQQRCRRARSRHPLTRALGPGVGELTWVHEATRLWCLVSAVGKTTHPVANSLRKEPFLDRFFFNDF